MKKKTIEKLEKKKINTEGLKTLKPLLKGINVKTNKLKKDDMYSTWPITGIVDEDTDLKISSYRVALLNNKGLYYCELQDVMEDEKDMVYLAFYNDMKVKELLFADEDASIEPHSFYSFGIRPDFETLKFLDRLIPLEENFVDIIKDEMKKTKKEAKKLIKKQKNQN